MWIGWHECQLSPFKDGINYLGDFNSNLSLKILSYDGGVIYFNFNDS